MSAAGVAGPIAGGRHGRPFIAAVLDLAAAGFVEEEFFFSGTAATVHAECERDLGSAPTAGALPDNDMPFHHVVNAGLVHLQHWLEGGRPPPASRRSRSKVSPSSQWYFDASVAASHGAEEAGVVLPTDAGDAVEVAEAAWGAAVAARR